MTAINTAQAYTQLWIEKVVIGLNFCPFAAKEVKLGSSTYNSSLAGTAARAIDDVALCIYMLNTQPSVETAFLIFENNYSSFKSYLELLSKSEKWLKKNNYKGVYQLASFHPQYIFEGSNEQDAANYTNRSPYTRAAFLT